MSRRVKISIIVIIIALVILAAVVFAPTFFKKPPVTNENMEKDPFLNTNFPSNTEVRVSPDIEDDTQGEIITKEPSSQSVLIAIAKTFAEKFGSFSNQANFENLRNTKYYMTQRMKMWTDDYIEKNKNIQNTDEFYGVTTRAIKVDIITLSDDESQAQVLVSTQQEEYANDVSSRGKLLYKRLMLDFKKENDQWKVDAAVWQ